MRAIGIVLCTACNLTTVMSSTTGAVTASPSTSSNLASLPVINITPYLERGDKAGRLSVSAALHAACLEYGFFYLDISQYADPAEPAELTRLAREFFALPQEEKDKISLQNQDYARGMSSNTLGSGTPQV